MGTKFCWQDRSNESKNLWKLLSNFFSLIFKTTCGNWLVNKNISTINFHINASLFRHEIDQSR